MSSIFIFVVNIFTFVVNIYFYCHYLFVCQFLLPGEGVNSYGCSNFTSFVVGLDLSPILIILVFFSFTPSPEMSLNSRKVSLIINQTIFSLLYHNCEVIRKA